MGLMKCGVRMGCDEDHPWGMISDAVLSTLAIDESFAHAG